MGSWVRKCQYGEFLLTLHKWSISLEMTSRELILIAVSRLSVGIQQGETRSLLANRWVPMGDILLNSEEQEYFGPIAKKPVAGMEH